VFGQDFHSQSRTATLDFVGNVLGLPVGLPLISLTFSFHPFAAGRALDNKIGIAETMDADRPVTAREQDRLAEGVTRLVGTADCATGIAYGRGGNEASNCGGGSNIC
jgi:hypothetical protein